MVSVHGFQYVLTLQAQNNVCSLVWIEQNNQEVAIAAGMAYLALFTSNLTILVLMLESL